MSKMVKRILLGGLVIGLFVANITVCYKIGANIKERRIAAIKIAEKERQTNLKIDTAEMVGRMIERSNARKQLEKDLLADYEKHKNDKPIPASKPITEQEKKDLNLG